jgi:hypothetical protein
MVSGALEWKRQFVEVGQVFLGILPSSRALRWLAPGTVLGVVVASPSHMVADVNGLACFLHHLKTYNC